MDGSAKGGKLPSARQRAPKWTQLVQPYLFTWFLGMERLQTQVEPVRVRRCPEHPAPVPQHLDPRYTYVQQVRGVGMKPLSHTPRSRVLPLQEWKDYKLGWDESEYGGVHSIRLPSSRVWNPDILMYNR